MWWVFFLYLNVIIIFNNKIRLFLLLNVRLLYRGSKFGFFFLYFVLKINKGLKMFFSVS